MSQENSIAFFKSNTTSNLLLRSKIKFTDFFGDRDDLRIKLIPF